MLHFILVLPKALNNHVDFILILPCNYFFQRETIVFAGIPFDLWISILPLTYIGKIFTTFILAICGFRLLRNVILFSGSYNPRVIHSGLFMLTSLSLDRWIITSSILYITSCTFWNLKKNLLLEINYDNKEGPGIHGTGSARKLAVVSKAHTLESGRFSSCNNFHREILRRNELFVLTYFE